MARQIASDSKIPGLTLKSFYSSTSTYRALTTEKTMQKTVNETSNSDRVSELHNSSAVSKISKNSSVVSEFNAVSKISKISTRSSEVKNSSSVNKTNNSPGKTELKNSHPFHNYSSSSRIRINSALDKFANLDYRADQAVQTSGERNRCIEKQHDEAGVVKQRKFFHRSLAVRMKSLNTKSVPWRRKKARMSSVWNKNCNLAVVDSCHGKPLKSHSTLTSAKRRFDPVAVLLPAKVNLGSRMAAQEVGDCKEMNVLQKGTYGLLKYCYNWKYYRGHVVLNIYSQHQKFYC